MKKKRNLTSPLIATLFLTFTTFVLSQCKKDEDFTLVSEASPILGGMPLAKKLAATGITSDSYYLINALPTGFVRDGTRDYTTYIQNAVNKYSNVVFPAFPILVNDSGINIGSNKTITFEAGSELRLKASSNDKYCIIKIANSTNVTLYNPVIAGDRATHIGTSGEWGMGIGIYGSSNVKIYSPKISNCWGDGIYIGQYNSSIACKNIEIRDAYLLKNRRDGISIISVDGLILDNLYAGYTQGTSPQCGINIEANNAACVIKNVRINNPRTEFNGANGIQIGLSRGIGSTDKNVDVTIVNHFDTGSPRFAFKVSCRTDNTVTGKLAGKISTVNPTWQKTAIETNQPLWFGSNHPGLKVVISSPAITTASGSWLSWSDTYNLLMKLASAGTLVVTNEPELITQSPLEPIPNNLSSPVIFAVNTGGGAFTASNGVYYSADKNYSNGSPYSVTYPITNTTDDLLYQSERYGNFSYAVPLSNGIYEITFKTSENYHKASGKRRFDILAEGTEVISNLDIFSVAGYAKAYDIIKTVTVSDGILNLVFRTDVDHAKISAFHIVKK